ncbi:MAG: signal peptidase I [Spirochaetaceae bacterium]|jgi:signal peptidase I|nr:signal peptidase I [Spirochaetaceae bacterium]
MAHKWLKYSYAAQKDQHHRIRGWMILVVGFLLFYTLLSTFFFSTGVLENETMLPGLRRGDRFIFLSCFIYRILPGSAAAGGLRRGNIVLVDIGGGRNQQVLVSLADTLVRFFTAQRVSIAGREKHHFIKRIIALPGDEVSMTKFVLRVRPGDSSYSLTEFEIIDKPYNVTIPQNPALWDESLPFSGDMEPLVLGEDEYFVLSDDRSNTNDSRTWGAIPIDFIEGKALFRYWPATRLGLP